MIIGRHYVQFDLARRPSIVMLVSVRSRTAAATIRTEVTSSPLELLKRTFCVGDTFHLDKAHPCYAIYVDD